MQSEFMLSWLMRLNKRQSIKADKPNDISFLAGISV